MNAEEKRAFNKELLTLAVPLGLQVLLTALVGASDALMLGRLNQESVAAVSLANQISFVMSLFVSSVVGSVGVLVAQYLGKKDERNAKRFMSMALRYSFLISLVFTLAALLAPEKLMALYTPEPELIDIGAGYLRIVSVSYLLSGISQCYLMVMKIDGRARLSVWISALTVLVDMGLDFFLIYGYGAIPALGANGSAYSTIAVEAVALVWCVWDGHRKGHLHPDMESMRYFSRKRRKGSVEDRSTHAGQLPFVGTEHHGTLHDYGSSGHRRDGGQLGHGGDAAAYSMPRPWHCQRFRHYAGQAAWAERI